jgi:hypothetical protein
MVRTRLIIEVEDAVWQRQLFSLTKHILSNLEKHLGRGLVDDLEFRVVPPRRDAQRAVASTPALELAPQDEAESIPDPMLRAIYKVARKKALA